MGNRTLIGAAIESTKLLAAALALLTLASGSSAPAAVRSARACSELYSLCQAYVLEPQCKILLSEFEKTGVFASPEALAKAKVSPATAKEVVERPCIK